MKLEIKFAEISDYIKNRYNEQLTFAGVSERELQVTYHKLFMSKSIDFSIDDVRNDGVTLRYNAGFGIDSLISLGLSFVNRFPIGRAIIPEEGHRIRIELNELKQAEKALESLALEDIRAKEEGLNIVVRLK